MYESLSFVNRHGNNAIETINNILIMLSFSHTPMYTGIYIRTSDILRYVETRTDRILFILHYCRGYMYTCCVYIYEQ